MKTFYWFLLALVMSLNLQPVSAQVKIERRGGDIYVTIDGKPYTTLFAGLGTAKPYLSPLRSVSGKVVTRRYPMQNIAGESHDHPHHRGLWFSHGDVNGIDFWGNEPSQSTPKTGKIVLKNVDKLTGGKDSGTIEATFNWVDPLGQVLLVESKTITFYAGSGSRSFDYKVVLNPTGKATFGDTKEGTFAIRLAPSLEEPTKESLVTPKRTGLMVSSEGGRGEQQVWGHRADWVDYFGEVSGEKLGVAILDHPSNPRHPTYWHSRSYGLFAANIFGLHDFLKDKNANGSFTIEAGHPAQFQYRVIIHAGDYETAHIAEQYKNYVAGKRP